MFKYGLQAQYALAICTCSPHLDIKSAIRPVTLLKSLSEQRQNPLIGLVSLREHGLTRLRQYVVVGVTYHLGSHIRITDLGFGCLGVLNNVVKVLYGVLKSVLNCTEIRTLL